VQAVRSANQRIERSTYLPFALPDIGGAEIESVREVLESRWLTTGPKAQQFEAEFAAYVGAKYAVAVNSCTAGMHLALESAGVTAGDIVLTTPYTFAATAEVVRYFDAVPVFVDVDPATCNLDPDRLAETIEDLIACFEGGRGPRLETVSKAVRMLAARDSARSDGKAPAGRPALKAVIPVHMAGQPCDMDRIGAIADEHGLAVIEDAAHACSAAYRGKPVGSQLSARASFAACFSFYATKTLATGEGGMVTTDCAETADRIRVMSLHGISRDAWKRYTAEGSWYYEVIAPGYKYNMPDLLAALGLAQLRRVEEMRQRRAEIAQRYTEAFARYPELETPTVLDEVRHAWHLYMLRLRPAQLPITRHAFIDQLKKRNIGASVHFIPLHVHPYYRDTYGYVPEDCPVALHEYEREISLPLFSGMSDFDAQSVIDAVCATIDQCRAGVSYARV
jgi:dTDP-4-amino-4,6-dideoxygalactose transaminase